MSASKVDGHQLELVTTVIGLDKTHLLDHEAFTADQISEVFASKGLKKVSTGTKYEARIYSDSIHFELTRNEVKLPDIDYKNIVQFVTLPDYPDVCFILSKKRAQGQYMIIRFEKPKQIATLKRLVKHHNNRVLFAPAEPRVESSDDGDQRSPSPGRKPVVLQQPPPPSTNYYSRPPKKYSEPPFTTTYVTNCRHKEHRPPCKHMCPHLSGPNHHYHTHEVQTSPILCLCPHHAKAISRAVGQADCEAAIVVAVQTDPQECHCIGHRHRSACRKADESRPARRKPQTIQFVAPVPQPPKTTQTKPKCTCKHADKVKPRPRSHSPPKRHPCRCSKSRLRRPPPPLPLPVNAVIDPRDESSPSSFSRSNSSSDSESSYKVYCAHIDRKRASRIMGAEDYEWPQTRNYVRTLTRRPRRLGGY